MSQVAPGERRSPNCLIRASISAGLPSSKRLREVLVCDHLRRSKNPFVFSLREDD